MPVAISSIVRLGADAAEAIVAAYPDGDGRRTVGIPIESIGMAASLLLVFRDWIEVLTPAELRAELRSSAVKLIELYAEGSYRCSRQPFVSPPKSRRSACGRGCVERLLGGEHRAVLGDPWSDWR